MLNIPDLAAQWGKIFGGVNQIDTFRGTTMPARADTISALYVTAAEQRLAAEGLYDQVNTLNTGMGGTVDYFFNLAKNTLKVAAEEDTDYPINTSDEDVLLKKLIDDAVAQAETFQEPTVLIGGAVSATGTPVTTLLGSPFGNGTVLGTVVNPRTGNSRYYAYVETVRVQCTADSYTGGVTAGNETFSLDTFATVANNNSDWPKGSGVTTTVSSALSSGSTLYGNAYFGNWGTVNIPDSWVLETLVPGTTISQSSDSYIGDFAAEFTAAPLNSGFYQNLTGFAGNTNYAVGIRIKRPGIISVGVITVALRDSAGVILTDAQGANLSFTVNLVAGAGDYTLTTGVFSVPRGFPTTVRLSVRFTTAMAAAEAIRIGTIDLIPMTSVYVGGPDIAFLPGSQGWASGDTYTWAVTNTAGKATFVKLFDRLYDARTRELDLPVDAVPTISDALIS